MRDSQDGRFFQRVKFPSSWRPPYLFIYLFSYLRHHFTPHHCFFPAASQFGQNELLSRTSLAVADRSDAATIVRR